MQATHSLHRILLEYIVRRLVTMPIGKNKFQKQS